MAVVEVEKTLLIVSASEEEYLEAQEVILLRRLKLAEGILAKVDMLMMAVVAEVVGMVVQPYLI